MVIEVLVFGVVIICGAALLRSYLCRRIAHILTGDQRRSLFPLEVPLTPGSEEVLSSKEVSVQRELHQLKDGSKIFCQVIKPLQTTPTHVHVFFHGYTSQSDLYLEVMSSLAKRGAIVLMPDLPCHGRSDGLLCYMPDWWAWVDQIWETLELVVPKVRNTTTKPMPVFASGISLGGGLTACLAVQRPTFFDGIVLIAPMLFVSDEIKPPWIVQQVFKYFLAPLLPTWPITPTKSMDAFDFRVEEQGYRYVKANCMSMKGLAPRLGTAFQLGFTFPDWMKHRLESVKTPFLVLHGTADKITDPDMSQQLYDKACCKDKSIKFYDGAFHCELLCCLPGNAKLIEMEWLPSQVGVTNECCNDIAEWIAARAK
eukprot:TRINITY_DN50855_c0_g1_i1.p1 TRINITY_DN50855_c0_g1~~TRINITY_DN50855_c0_g1_i1.p1  ORF type:complete len:369 (-),score=56.16 TRINITY_DN50855_c0_g1_i1:105-1211(-)